jgi:hypothetical protein
MLLAVGSKPLTDDEQLYLRLLDHDECMFLVREEICTYSENEC